MNRNNRNKRLAGDTEYNFSTPEAIERFIRLSYLTRDSIRHDRISKQQLMQMMNTIDAEQVNLCAAINLRVQAFLSKETSDLFCPSITENIIALIEIYAYGYYQSGDPVFFNHWMKDINLSLSSVTPLDHCRDILGREEVKREIAGLKNSKNSTR